MWKLLSGVLIYALTVSQVFGQAALLPNAKQTFLDTVGNPLVGGTVTSYVPGSTNKKTTWQDSGETSNNPNPVTLDAAGRAVIYGQGNYRQVVKDANGNTIWDASTTAYGSSQPSGATGTDTAPIGSIIQWSGFVLPINWTYANGQTLARADYPDLLADITIVGTAVSCTSGSAILGGWADTSQMRVGAPVEATCIPTGTTITRISSATTITVSNNATSTSTVTAQVFPWGDGDGALTFNLPDLRGRAPVGSDTMQNTAANRLTVSTTISTTNGSSTATVASATGLYLGMAITSINVPFNATISAISGTSLTLSANATATASGTAAVFGPMVGANTSGAFGGALSSILATTNLPPYTPSGAVTALNQSGIMITAGVQQGPTSGGTLFLPAVAGTTFTFAGNAQGGLSIPLPVIQPIITTTFIIKVKNNTTGAGGVVSWGGLIGDIATDTTLRGYISGGVNWAGLATQADATMLANTSGAVAAPVPSTITAWLDYAGSSSAQGTILSRGASVWAGLPPAANDGIGRFLRQVNGVNSWATAGAGTVQSVGLAMPGIFTVSGSPVTVTGTLTASLANESANQVWAGPTSGVAASPAFRPLVGADLPVPSATTLGGVQSYAGVSHQWLSSISTLGAPVSTQPAFADISGTLANGQLANAGAWTIKGNATASSAAPADFTIGGLTQKASPAGTDLILIQDQAASGAFKFATVSSVASAGSVASIGGLTGAIGLGPGLATSGSNIQLASGTVVGHAINTIATALTDTAGNMPGVGSNTAPTTSMGTQYVSLTYTPKSSSNVCVMKVWGNASSSVAGYVQIAGFTSASSNAKTTGIINDNTLTGVPFQLSGETTFTCGSFTSATGRFGLDRAGTGTLNGASGSQLGGGALVSGIEITEYVP